MACGCRLGTVGKKEDKFTKDFVAVCLPLLHRLGSLFLQGFDLLVVDFGMCRIKLFDLPQLLRVFQKGRRQPMECLVPSEEFDLALGRELVQPWVYAWICRVHIIKNLSYHAEAAAAGLPLASHIFYCKRA